MALSRRSSNRFQNAIWPGFVDAMTGILLVLMFVLTIFMVIQFTLRETITGQESQLDDLTAEVATLTSVLGLERDRNAALSDTLDDRDSRITALLADRSAQDAALADAQAQITGLLADRDAANAEITAFEARVAGLLADRDRADARITSLEAARDDAEQTIATLQSEQAELMTQQEALNLALAQARSEIDESAEAARLSAARREALEALVADLRSENSANTTRIAELEAEGLADAAAAQALRDRLANADTELTAMTLNLEAQRKRAEDTLTLLAAAQAARAQLEQETARLENLQADLQSTSAENADLTERLANALSALAAAEAAQATQMTEAERQAALLAQANSALSQQEALSADSQRQVALLNEQVTALRNQVGNLQALLDLAEDSDAEAQIEIDTLGAQLNAALARAAAEERERRALQEAETQRLAAEAQRLERFKSDFFGQLRDLLEGQDRIRIEGDRFVFSSEVLFEPARAELSEAGRAEIANIAGILRDISSDIPDSIDWVIRVDGHTDDTALGANSEYADNWELSQARALSVVRFMTDELDIPPQRLAANGFGEYQPLNPADTAEARAQNRRIELKLTER